MQVTAKRRIVTKLADKGQFHDGSLSLTLNTDLFTHDHLAQIPVTELNRELNEALDRLIVRFSVLKMEHDKRKYSE